ncbi:phosphatase PAP2 family protein [Georgenia sp. H159]|uniref:phosphatase PAP2 family protein n=1 Tax=Georgenia sp. H159 TaxID=3076115 RepID=UPI002D77247B|nr:phosphatase PAP2 family protein [Georgenia sp. H159]
MSDRTSLTSRRTAALSVVLAVVGVVVSWGVFVTTTAGQRAEETALTGSAIGRWRIAEETRSVLDVVSVSFLALVILVGVSVALLRRQWLTALAVPLVVGGANVTTQLLKYEVFSRPDLGVSAAHVNSLPSGHTTVAASAAAVAVLVSPPRWRWVVALVGWAYAGGTGLATMVNGWHRASDVVAAVFVVLAWGALAELVLGAREAPPDGRANRVTSRLLLAAAAGTGGLAVLALALTSLGTAPADARATLLVAYGGSGLGVVAVTCLTAGLLLHLHTAARAA